MKHTFWYIDQIMILLKDVPVTLGSGNALKRAEKDLNTLKKYDQKLRALIKHHKVKKHLDTLHACHVDSIPDWAERVEEQFRRLDALLRVLEEDIPKLEQCLTTKQDEWASTIRDMSLGMVQTGLHSVEEHMAYFRKAEVFERHHLEQIIGDLTELEEILQ